MTFSFHIEYWQDGEFFVGRIAEVPSCFSQGHSVEELKENLREVYHLMFDDESRAPVSNKTTIETLELAV